MDSLLADESDENIVETSIEEFNLVLSIAENDFNENKRCLFATMIWSGATVMAQYIASSSERHRILKKSVIEFGAAAGLPSIVCSLLGASRVCASDYPSKAVIENLNKNVTRNCNSSSSISVVPHLWGESVVDLLQRNDGNLYDLVVAAECLWHHTSHPLLITSISNVLKPGGSAIITFSHHVPGLENDDLNFFTLAEQQGLKLMEKKSFSAPHMWSDKQATIFLYELIKT